MSGSDDGTVKVWRVTGTSPLQEVTTLQVGSPVKSISMNSKTMDLAVAAEGRTDVIVYGLAGIDRGSKISSRSWK